MQTVPAWLENEDRSGAATFLSAVPDQLVTTSGDNLRLNSLFSNIAFMYSKTNTDSYLPQDMTLSAPTIASNPLKWASGIGVTWNGEASQSILDMTNACYPYIRPGDDVTSKGFETDQAGTAHNLINCIIVTDQPSINYDLRSAPPITHTAEATVTGNSTAGEWTSYSMSLVDTLPAGRYAMSGASVLGATVAASRFIFKTGGVSRPAVIPRTNTSSPLHPFSRYWGGVREFIFPDNLPELEYLSSTAETPGDITLFLTKVA